jgi:hypothetical protein
VYSGVLENSGPDLVITVGMKVCHGDDSRGVTT